MNNSLNSNVEALYKLEDGKAEVLEFLLKENSAVIQLKATATNPSRLNICGCFTFFNVIRHPRTKQMIPDIKEILED